MKNTPKLVDVMTKDPETIDLGQPLSEVYVLFQARSFHHVPVLDGDSPVGLISAADILKLVYDVDGHSDQALRTHLDHQFTIEDAMTTDLVTVKSGDPLSAAVELMSSGAIHSVLILDDDGKLEGIITSTDLIRQLGRML